jgi:phage-related protein
MSGPPILSPSDVGEIIVYIQGNAKALYELARDDLERVVVEFGGLTDPIGQLENWLSQQFQSVVNAITTAVQQIISPVINAVNTVANWVQQGFNAFTNTVNSALGNLQNALSSGLQTVYNVLSNLPSTLQNTLQTVQNALQNAFQSALQSAQNALSNLISGLQNAVQSALGNIQSALSGLSGTLQSWLSTVTSTLSSVGSTIASGLSTVQGVLSSALQTVQNALTTGISTLQSVLSSVWNAVQSIPSQIQGFFGQIYNALQSVYGVLSGVASAVAGQVQAAFSQFFGTVQNFFTQVWTGLQNIYNVITSITVPQVQNVFTQIYNAITSIPSAVESGISTIRSALTSFFDDVKSALSKIGDLLSLLNTAAATFVNSFSTAQNKMSTGLQLLKQHVEDIVKTITSLPDLFAKIPLLLAMATYSAVYDALTQGGGGQGTSNPLDIFKKFMQFISTLENEMEIFAKAGPLGYMFHIGQLLEQNLQTFANYIAGAVYSFFGKLWGALQQIGNTLIDVFKTGINAVSGAFLVFVDMVKGGLKKFFDMFVQPALHAIYDVFQFFTHAPIKLQAGQDPVTVYGPNILTPILEIGGLSALALLALATPAALVRGLAHAAGDQEVAVEPAGLGVKIRLRLGEIVAAMAKVFEEMPKEIGRAMSLSGFLAFLEPLRYISRYFYWVLFTASGATELPFELPGHGELLEVARRFDVYSTFNRVASTYMFRGLPYWYISYMAEVPQTPYISIPVPALDEYRREMQAGYITVVDRFGNTRMFPLSPLFRLPAESDLVHFMLRDLFLPLTQNPAQAPPLALKSFLKAMWAHGVPPDAAMFYYLRAFELPSPTQLWNFTARALSGMAWFKPPRAIMDFAVSEAQLLGAFQPAAPVDVNFQYELALTALAEYQKWHGRAHFAWLPGYTSDAWIIIDQEAHLADRGDIAHMIRFGVFDYMSQRGVTMETELKDTVAKVLDAAPASPMTLDIRQASRFLVARGFHPYVAPLIAIRDLLDVTTAARTLLRTGLINLVRENAETVKVLDAAMSGLFNMSALVAYFDLDQLRWVEGWFNIPIYYLAPERALLLLRAVYDKAVAYMRHMLRAATAAARDNLLSIGDAIKAVAGYVSTTLDQYIYGQVKAITGKEFHLTWDKDFETAISQYMSLEQQIATLRRLRYYARYSLYRVLYLVGRGLIPAQSIASYISDVADKMVETPQAVDLFNWIANLVYTYSVKELAVRYAVHALGRHAAAPQDVLAFLVNTARIDPDYAKALVNAYAIQYYPTAPQLATLAAYVPSALQYVDRVLQLNRVPPEMAAVWSQYITTRAYYAYVTRMATALIALLSAVKQDVAVLYGGKAVAVKDVLGAVSAVLSQYGFDSTKMALLSGAADLRMALYSYRLSYPTPREFLTDARYLPAPGDAMAKIANIWPLTDFGRQYYSALLPLRAYHDYVMRALTAYLTWVANVPSTIQIKLNGQIATWDQAVKSIQSLLQQYGLDAVRMNFVNLVADLRYSLTEYRHSFPTPRQFLADMLNVPDPDALYDQVSKFWIINDWGRQYIKSQIPYRRYRRWIFIIVDYVARAVGRGNMTPQDAVKLLQQLTKYGLSKYDMDIINYLIMAMQCYYSGCTVT